MTTSTTTFGGRYRLIERIGTGGMAEVYRARDELLGREVAVKILSDRFSRDRSFVERFRREAQAAANLNHPNIVVAVRLRLRPRHLLHRHGVHRGANARRCHPATRVR